MLTFQNMRKSGLTQVEVRHGQILHCWFIPGAPLGLMGTNRNHQKDASNPCLQWRKQTPQLPGQHDLACTITTQVKRLYQFNHDNIWTNWSYCEKSLVQNGYRTTQLLNLRHCTGTNVKNQRDSWKISQKQHSPGSQQLGHSARALQVCSQ